MRNILLCGVLFLSMVWGVGCPSQPPKKSCPKCADNEVCDVDKGACVPRANTCAVPCATNANCSNNEFCDLDNCCRPCLQGGLCGREAAPPDGGGEESKTEQTSSGEQNPDGSDTGEACSVREDCKPGLICDAARGICVCLRDSSCPAIAPRCGATGLCIQCLSDAECPITGQKCDPQTFRCKGGTTPCNCPEGQKCNDKDQCVPLCDGVTCPTDQRCDPKDGQCKVPGCLPIKGCPKAGDCCNEDGTCSPCGSGKICDPCQKAADCGDGNACHDLGGSKFCTRECTVNSCPSGFSCKTLGDYGRQCVPTSGTCSIDKCAGRQCPSGLYCCPKDGQCHDCCQDGHCPNSTCDLQSFTCKVNSGGCNPACGSGTKCCVNLGVCRACCSDSDCGGGGLVCNNGTCGPPVRTCRLSDPLGACSSDSECCSGQSCVAAGLGRNCEPCTADADCPRIGGIIPTSCCTQTISGQPRRYCATTCP